jgi:hypothetical protein
MALYFYRIQTTRPGRPRDCARPGLNPVMHTALGWISLALFAVFALAAFWLHPLSGVLFVAVVMSGAAVAHRARPAGKAGSRLAREKLPSME